MKKITKKKEKQTYIFSGDIHSLRRPFINLYIKNYLIEYHKNSVQFYLRGVKSI